MNNFYNGYSGYATPYQNYNILAQQKQQSVQNTQQSPFNDVRIATEAEATAHFLFPNTRVLLMDINNNVFWIKSADSLGQSVMEKYTFAKVDSNTASSTDAPKINYENFATKDELKTVSEHIERLDKKFDIIKKLSEDKPKKNEEHA